MVPEIGHFCLLLAALLAIMQCILPTMGILKDHPWWMGAANSLALGQCFFVTLAMMCLLYAFMKDDFSVQYVAAQSNSTLPWIYKISALWGGHAGSWLLWVWFLSLWVVTFSLCTSSLPLFFRTRVLIVLGVISVGLFWFLLATSNPFNRWLPQIPLDGSDLNPLLQDPGLIIHPPLLTLGTVGFAIPFAMALALLWGGNLQTDWAKWMRPWVLAAFSLLTIGITLGSYWAYYELGWGGWWFWDPVENASFVPWLLGIALIHALMMSDKRRVFQGWTLLLALMVFACSLIGTFLVRSGILVSVHAFASDPKKGIILLLFIFGLIGGSLLLYAIRSKYFINQSRLEAVSRGSSILLATGLLFVAAMTVLLGTLYPLVAELVFHHKISVGTPYFNRVFIPLMIPVLVGVPLGPLMKWEGNHYAEILKKIRAPLIQSLVLSFALPWMVCNHFNLTVSLGLFLAFWIILGTLKFAYQKIKNQQYKISALSWGAWGMIFAHSGIAVGVIGITMVSAYQIEKDLYMHPGQSIAMAGREITFKALSTSEGSNFVGHQGHFVITQEGKEKADLYPEKRLYIVPGSAMTETAIDAGLWGDIYISLGELFKDHNWSVRVSYKPMVRWIWFGGILIMLGALFAAIGRRLKS